MNILHFEAPHFADALRRLGHEVLSVGPKEECDWHTPSPVPALKVYQRACEAGFIPHAALFGDTGNVPCFPGMEALPCPSLFYSIDTFCNPWHVSYAHGFDAVGVAQKDHVALFSVEGHQAQWLPLFARQGHALRTQEDFSARDIPVTFVGSLRPANIPDRYPFLQAFQQRHPLLIETGPFVGLFNRSRVVLNQTAASEVNFRCFEALACGAALLMEQALHGLEELFVPGEHILPLYPRGNAPVAAAIARASLAHPQELEAIARRGHDEVHAKHMDTHRAQEIVRTLEHVLQSQSHEARLNTLPRRRKLVSAAYGMLAAEITRPGMEQHVAYFAQLCENQFSEE